MAFSDVLRYITPAPILRKQIKRTQEYQSSKAKPGSTLYDQYQEMIDRRVAALKFWPWRRERRQKSL